MAVQLIINKREAMCLEDALKAFGSKAQESTRDGILRQLDHLLRGRPNQDGWAPIKSSWPTGATGKRTSRSNSFFKNPRESTAKSAKQAKKPPTAQEILDSL